MFYYRSAPEHSARNRSHIIFRQQNRNPEWTGQWRIHPEFRILHTVPDLPEARYPHTAPEQRYSPSESDPAVRFLLPQLPVLSSNRSTGLAVRQT